MRSLFLLALTLLFFGCSTKEEPQSLAEVVGSITIEDMQSRIGILAHDSMGGRDTPSPGLEMAAAWSAGEFQRMGLEAGGGVCPKLS